MPDPTIVRHDFSQPATLNPLFPSGAGSAWDLFVLLFEWPVLRTLETGYDWNSDVVLGHELSPDLRSVTLELNPAARWHDGEPWTAHDLAFTVEVLKDERVPIAYWGTSRDLIERVEALSEHRARVTYSGVLAPGLRLEALAFPVVPKHILGDPEQRAADPTLRSSAYYNRYGREALIGSGPYRFVEWLPNDRVVVERWEDHFLFDTAPPAAKRVLVKFQSDRNLALLQFLSGEFDHVYVDANIFANQTDNAQFEARGVKARHPAALVLNVLWNLDGSNPFFVDRRVRRALAHAYDVETVRRRVGHDLYERSYGYMVEGRFDYEPSLRESPIEYDLERAAQLLDEAGWLADEDSGWRHKKIDGERVRFSFELAYNPGMTYAPVALDILRKDFRRIGVEVVTRPYENATLSQKRLSHDFQAVLALGGTSNDPQALVVQLGSDAYEGGRNNGGYSNPRVDELFTLAAVEQDAATRAALFRELHRIVYEDQPSLFLFHITFLWVLSNDLRGVELGPMGTVMLWPSPQEGRPSRRGAGWWREQSP